MSDFIVIFYYFLKNVSDTFKKLLFPHTSVEFGLPKECFLFTILIIDRYEMQTSNYLRSFRY